MTPDFWLGMLVGSIIGAVLVISVALQCWNLMKGWKSAAKDWEEIAVSWRESYYEIAELHGDQSTMNIEAMNGPPLERDRQATRNH